MDTLVFFVTLRCPLACEHCIVDSNPQRREVIDRDLVLRTIPLAAKIGVKQIGFTGGEPFMYPADLKLYCDAAQAEGLDTICITSGFFGSSTDSAMRVLRPFAGISMLGLSTDVYHQAFTDLTRIKNVIRAAEQLEISKIEVQVTFDMESKVASVREELNSEFPSIVVRDQPVWPVGQASRLLGRSRLQPLNKLDLSCPMVGPVIWPDGSIYGCCSALLRLGPNNPLSFGNLHAVGLSEVSGHLASDSYYNFLRLYGLAPLARLAEQHNLQTITTGGYTSVCHFCFDANSNTSFRQLIHAKFSRAAGA